jgi:LysR family glycine cleavage system transcriptional activator
MLSSLPPLKALRAFEAAARHLNVTRAAEELSVTQPAVTQQIRALEAFLGLQLVYRAGQGLALTPAGRSYADHLQLAFTEIDTATAELLMREKHGGPLTVSLLPTLAQRWLIPRLGSFQANHPEIEVHFSTTTRLVDLRREDVDIAIRFGEGTWPGCESTFLMANDMFPVIGAQLQAAQPLSGPDDLARHTWLRVDAEPRSHDWNAWLASAGVNRLAPKGWLTFESSSQALAAAAAGIGVAIGHRPFVLDDLSSGRLVQPLSAVVESKQAYYVVTPAGVPVSMRVAAFRDWLLAEAQQGNTRST